MDWLRSLSSKKNSTQKSKTSKNVKTSKPVKKSSASASKYAVSKNRVVKAHPKTTGSGYVPVKKTFNTMNAAKAAKNPSKKTPIRRKSSGKKSGRR